MTAAAGMVVTEMKTPMSALARASVRDTTPTIPASVATTTEKTFGLPIRALTGRSPAERRRRHPGCADAIAKHLSRARPRGTPEHGQRPSWTEPGPGDRP